jgi:hypothetical protein
MAGLSSQDGSSCFVQKQTLECLYYVVVIQTISSEKGVEKGVMTPPPYSRTRVWVQNPDVDGTQIVFTRQHINLRLILQTEWLVLSHIDGFK